MKRLLPALLIFCALSGEAFSATFTPQPAMPWVDTKGHATLSAAASAAARRGVGVLVSTSVATITTSVTVTVPMQVVKGGQITKSGAGTIAINGPFDAGLHQAFSGFSAGDVTFGNGAVNTVHAAWFGASASGSAAANTTAIQIAIDSLSGDVGKVSISPGVSYNATLTIPKGVSLIDINRGQIIQSGIEFGIGTLAQHLTIRGHAASSVPRLYLVPNGSPTGTTAALKVFATDYEADQSNYADFGVFFSTTADKFYLNSTALGTVGRKAVAFAFKDGAEISAEMFPYSVTGTYYGGLALGGVAPTGLTMFASTPVFFVSDAAFVNNKMLRFYSASGVNLSTGIKHSTSNVLEFYHQSTVMANISNAGFAAQSITSISSAPTFTGQLAISGGNAYIATSTTGTSDWHKATDEVYYTQATPNTSVTGTTVETTLWSTTIPGGTMTANSTLDLIFITTQTNNANNKFIQVYLGSQAIYSGSGYNVLSTAATRGLVQIINAGAVNSQIFPNALIGFGNIASLGTGAVDMSVDQTLSVKSTLGNAADTLTLKYVGIDVKRAD